MRRISGAKLEIALLVAGLVLRVAYAITVRGDNVFSGWDGKEYHAYAQSILAGQGDVYPHFLNCIRAPFYPLFLVPFVAVNAQALWPIQLVQCLMGVFQAWLLSRIVFRWAGPAAGRWTLALALLHPFLIYYCAFVMTEILFITLLYGAVACLERVLNGGPERRTWYVIGAGCLLGAGCLTRPALQLFLPVAVVILAWRRRPAILLAAVCALWIVPWSLRNLSVHGEFTLAPRNAILVAAEGNSLEYVRMFEARTKDEYYATYDKLIARINVGPDNTPERLRESARRFRDEHRGEWWKLQFYKIRHFWTPWLNPLIFPKSLFLISVVTFTPLFVLAALELWRRRRQTDSFLWLLVGIIGSGFVVGGLLFHAAVRYRIPFVDVTCLMLTGSWLGNALPSLVQRLRS